MKRTRFICMAMAAVLTFMAPQAPELMAAKKSKKVQLNKKKATLYVGEKLQLKVKNTKKKAKWSTSKKAVATVTKKGKVTAKKKGTAKITAKIAKKKYVCKLTVKNIVHKPTQAPNIAKPAVTGITISSVNVIDAYTIQVQLSGAQALTKENFTVKTKNYNIGNYNRELKILSVSTTDNVTYQITIDMGRAIFEDEFVQVTVNNLSGTGTSVKETLYSEGKFNYQRTAIFEAMQNEEVDQEYYMSGKGYTKVNSVTGLPAGVTYKVSKDGSDIIFDGKPAAAGTFTGAMVIEDEVGNTYTVKTVWVVGSEKTIAAAYEPQYGVAGTGLQSFYSDITICGGSGNYVYEFLDKKDEYYISSNGDLEIVLEQAGTYQIKVKITDAEDSTITTTAVCDISYVKGKTISGIIRDGLGNAIQGESMNISFKNKDKANLYTVRYSAYSQNTGAYSATLAEGTYEIYAYYNDTRSSMITCQMNTDKSGVDFVLPVYPVKITSDNQDFNILSGYWYDEDGEEYSVNAGQIYLKEGTHKLTNSYSTGFKVYDATLTVTVTASKYLTAKAVVTEKNILDEKLKGSINAGESLEVKLNTTDYIYYSFTPEETKRYRIYSKTEDGSYYDTYGILRDENGKQVSYNDGGGDNGNFSFTYECEKGKKYYIGISKFGGTYSSDTVLLCVEEYVPDTELY